MPGQIPQNFRRVVVAAAVGNVIECTTSTSSVVWPRPVGQVLRQNQPGGALLSTIALFTAGFLIRPLAPFCSDIW